MRSRVVKALCGAFVVAVAAVFPAGAAAEIYGAPPDEGSSQAYGPLQRGVTYSGAFASQSDVDYLSFVVSSPGQTLDLTVRNTTQVCQDPYDAGCPVYATLMDSTGQNQVGGSNSDAGTIATYGDTESFAWTFAQSGTYYVLMESDGDLPAGSPSYAVTLSGPAAGSGGTGGSGGGGGNGGGPSGGSGSSGGGSGGGGSNGASPLVRSLKVLPKQRGQAVSAVIVLTRGTAWLRAAVLSPRQHDRAVARHLYRHLARGLHHLTLRLPAAYRRRLTKGQRLSLLLKIMIASQAGRPVTILRPVTLSG
jgi:hypothetical protein